MHTAFRRHSHLPLDVVLEQVVVHGVELRAAHVVVVVGDGAVELLAVGAVLPLVGLVAVVVVIVTCGGGMDRGQTSGFEKGVHAINPLWYGATFRMKGKTNVNEMTPETVTT